MKYKVHKDARGSLMPIEFSSLPFTPKRVFCVYDVPAGEVRGEHAHHKTQQVIVCTKGVVEVITHNGAEETSIVLNESDSVLIPAMIWDSQKFITPDSSIMVLCSTEYDIEDYITDFNEFESLTQ